MPSLKIQKIVSFSSEDPLFPASNLLKNGKWRCKEEGEKAPWVMFQLEKLSTITSINIGNSGSAFIEVQVGRQGEDLSQMPVLLPASSFMSVNEARVSQNRVRTFGPETLEAEVSKQKWNLVKVVATQPFNMTTKFGFSFIDIRGSNGEMTPLMEAVSTGLAGDVLRLIAEGAEVNDKDYRYPCGTPLMCACETGNEEVVRVLLKDGAHVDNEDCDGLKVAVAQGYCGVTR